MDVLETYNRLPPHRQSIFDYIIEYCNENGGIPPTVREIQAAIGISSTSVVALHLNKLIEADLLRKRRHNQDRSYMVNGGKWDMDWNAPAEPGEFAFRAKSHKSGVRFERVKETE
jgi:SOS-response transcriptional repressor LexA